MNARNPSSYRVHVWTTSSVLALLTNDVHNRFQTKVMTWEKMVIHCHSHLLLCHTPSSILPFLFSGLFLFVSVFMEQWTHSLWCWSCFVWRRPVIHLHLPITVIWKECTSNCYTMVRPQGAADMSRWAQLSLPCIYLKYPNNRSSPLC